MMGQITIKEFYSKKSVLITGVTGTLGSVVLYYLLATFSDIGDIFALIRDRNGLNGAQRLIALMKGEIFQSIPTDQKQKVKAVSGCMEADKIDFGDWILNEIDIVLHLAADVNFDTPLESAMRSNVHGTEAILKQFLASPRIQAFVHVSTAYINPELDILEEKVYKIGVSPLQVMETLANETGNGRIDVEKRIIGEKINSYCFTKCLAENVVSKYSSSIPAAIVRVPMVSPCLSFPSPGYFDSLVGFNGIFVAAASGFLKYICVNTKHLFHLAPVDICASHILLAAVAVAQNDRECSPLQVFNVTNPNTMTWHQFLDTVHKAFRENPIRQSLWPTQLKAIKSWTTFQLLSFFFVLIPAIVCDICAMAMLQAPRASYICFKGYHRALVTCKVLQRDFKIMCANALSLRRFLQTDDSKLLVSFAEFELKPYCDSVFRHIHKYTDRLGGQKFAKQPDSPFRLNQMELVRLLAAPLLILATLCFVLVVSNGIYQMAIRLHSDGLGQAST